MRVTTGSAEETVALGQKIGQQLKGGQVVCLAGDLGTGKTTLVKGIASAVTGCSPDEVSSPTFVFHNRYLGPIDLIHFDLFRFKDADSFLELGFDEYLRSGAICCIEWSERIAELIPEDAIKIEAAHTTEGKREFVIDGF